MAKPKKRKKTKIPQRSKQTKKSKKLRAKAKKKTKPKARSISKAQSSKSKKKVKPKKLVFEARKKSPIDVESPPEGFTINVGEPSQDEAYAVIMARLEDAMANLPTDFVSDAHINVVPMADGSVDGELYVVIPDNTSTDDAEWAFYQSFTSISVGRKYWISTGVRYDVKDDEARYQKHRGLASIQTNYQRATETNIVEEHLILRDKIIAGMERKFGEEVAHSIFIRLHYNPQGIQPKR